MKEAAKKAAPKSKPSEGIAPQQTRSLLSHPTQDGIAIADLDHSIEVHHHTKPVCSCSHAHPNS